MSQMMDSSLSSYATRSIMFIQHTLRGLRPFAPTLSISELLLQVEESTEAATLTKTINRLQSQLWKLSVKEQAPLRALLIDALSKHVLHAPQAALRLEAAGWLRLFVQTGSIIHPTEVFVTLVTAAVQTPLTNKAVALKEQSNYLKMIFECFWPFRHPYPAYKWQDFPANEVFYPLASLLSRADVKIQAMLIAIFAELPSLDDAEIVTFLLPIALAQANHADAEHRRRITGVLARMSANSSQEALYRLLSDPDTLVRASAKHASSYPQRA